MTSTPEERKEWWDEGLDSGATHMIVVTDTFDYDDYPVYVKPGQDAHQVAEKYDNKDMQRIMEVFSYKLSWDEQSKEYYSFHWEV